MFLAESKTNTCEKDDEEKQSVKKMKTIFLYNMKQYLFVNDLFFKNDKPWQGPRHHFDNKALPWCSSVYF